jgi:RNA polymerase sigma-70 factor (ECF subfamily)
MGISSILPAGCFVALPRPAMSSKASSDQALIGQIASGNQLAMRVLFGRHYVSLFRFLVRMVRDKSLAEDLTSEVFLDVWRQSVHFEGRASVSTWLLAIGRFKALSALRRPKHMELDDEMESTIVDPADDPEVVLQKKESDDALRKCVATLRPAQTQIIDLVYYYGKSVAEAAAIVGVSEATAKTRMFYARKKLADLISA